MSGYGMSASRREADMECSAAMTAFDPQETFLLGRVMLSE